MKCVRINCFGLTTEELKERERERERERKRERERERERERGFCLCRLFEESKKSCCKNFFTNKF